MRIRQVRPEFWTDPIVGRLPYPVRLFYIGLWNVADDAGWMAWRPAEIGALLYPYQTPTARERALCAWADVLVKAGRLVIHECGCAQVPTLPRHQRIGGNQSFTQRDKHDRHRASGSTNGVPVPPITDLYGQVRGSSPVTLGNVEERNVEERYAREAGPTLSRSGLLQPPPGYKGRSTT